jgi:hypothetical protein
MAHYPSVAKAVVDSYLELILPEFVRDYCESNELATTPGSLRRGRNGLSTILVPYEGSTRVIKDVDVLELVVAPSDEDIPMFLALRSCVPMDMKDLCDRLQSVRDSHSMRQLHSYMGSTFYWELAFKIWTHRLAGTTHPLSDFALNACLAAIEEAHGDLRD